MVIEFIVDPTVTGRGDIFGHHPADFTGAL